MSNYVLLRLEGEDRVWLVDFEGGSVTPVDGDGADLAASGGATVTSGGKGFSGIDMAVLARSRREAASQKFYGA
jgi:hypothetical protein